MSYRMIEAARRLMCDKFSILCTLAELNEKQLREDDSMNINERISRITKYEASKPKQPALIGMDKNYEQVREFHKNFGHPVADKPTYMKLQRSEERYAYMLEELNEFAVAGSVVDQADAMIDLMYFALGTLVEIGVKPDALFDIVQQANMSKVWPDGTVKYDPITNKILKPPTFVRPEPLLQAEIERQING